MGGRQNTSNSTEKRWNRGRHYGKIEVNYDDNISTQEEERKQITVRRPSLQTKRTVIYSRSSSGNPQQRQIRSRWGRCQICPANSNRRYTCRTLVECWQEVYSEHEKSGFQPRTDIYTRNKRSGLSCGQKRNKGSDENSETPDMSNINMGITSANFRRQKLVIVTDASQILNYIIS